MAGHRRRPGGLNLLSDLGFYEEITQMMANDTTPEDPEFAEKMRKAARAGNQPSLTKAEILAAAAAYFALVSLLLVLMQYTSHVPGAENLIELLQ